MALRMRAFVIWAVLPYLSLVVLELIVRGPRANMGIIFRSFTSRVGLFIFFACLGQAVLGTIILWLIPVKRAWVGITTGLAIATGVIAISIWLELQFFSGFEANVGIYVTAIMLVVPSFVAAGYAGVLRTRER